MKNKKKCFVIMPFSKTYKLDKGKWAEVFEHKIKRAVEESGFGYNCERYELRRANITKDILQKINGVHVVIADLTGKNPNVLWELGVSHTLSKRTILIAQDKKFLPSDLKDYPIILYKYKQTPAEVDKFKDDIKEKLEDIETSPDEPHSPVADFLKVKNIEILSYEKSANLKKIAALISELSYNTRVVDIILDTIKENEEIRKKEPGKVGVPNLRFDSACLQLLLSTQYLIPPSELSIAVRVMNIRLKETNSALDLWGNPGFAEGVMVLLKNNLPELKGKLIHLLEGINELRVNYTNDNYVEPELTILVASPEHSKHIEKGK